MPSAPLPGPACSGRVGDDKDQLVEPAVTKLELEPALNGLEVVEDRLGFDRSTPRGCGHDTVPGAWVTGRRERNLGPKCERAMQDLSESFEEPQVTGIPDRITKRVGPDRDGQADRSGGAEELVDPDALETTSLEPAQL